MNSFKNVWIFFLIVVIIACSKNNDPDPVPQSANWSIDSGATQAADTISFIRLFGYNYITCTKGTTKITLSTNAVTTGSYTSLNANGTILITINSIQYSPVSCSINISSNANSRIGGNFSGTLSDVNANRINISGTFENVRVY